MHTTRRNEPTEEQIEEIFDRFLYDKDTGEFHDLKGSVKPSLRNGYLVLYAAGQQWPLHRLVWLAETGDWPTGQVRFRDRNASNTLFSNLYQPMSQRKRQWRDGDEVFEHEATKNINRCASPEAKAVLDSWQPIERLIFA